MLADGPRRRLKNEVARPGFLHVYVPCNTTRSGTSGYFFQLSFADSGFTSERRPTVTAKRFKEAMDVLEAVARYQFSVYEGRKPKNAKIYFLSIPITLGKNKNNDLNAELLKASDELIKRFEGHIPPVKSVFHVTSSSPGTDVRDDQTGEKGIFFSAGQSWS